MLMLSVKIISVYAIVLFATLFRVLVYAWPFNLLLLLLIWAVLLIPVGCAVRLSVEPSQPSVPVAASRDRLDLIGPSQLLVDWSAWKRVEGTVMSPGNDRPWILEKR